MEEKITGVADVPPLGVRVGIGDSEQVRELSEQKPWKAEIPCPHCGKTAKLMLAVQDRMFGEFPNKRGDALCCLDIIGHDCTAIAVYGCTYCQKVVADWNCA
jgi:hypothetical protein